MERIQHPSLPGVIWWKGRDHATAQPVVNELGIFGAYVRYTINMRMVTAIHRFTSFI